MTQQSHFWAYTPRKPDLKETHAPQCSSQHCLSYPVFLSGKSHGQRSLTGYNHGDTKMLDMTQQLNNSNITLPAIEYGSSTNTPLKNIKRYFFKVKKRYPSSKISKRHVLFHIYSSIIHSCQDTETI